jgi:hypothetical protein
MVTQDYDAHGSGEKLDTKLFSIEEDLQMRFSTKQITDFLN